MECITDGNCTDTFACGDDNYCVAVDCANKCAANARCDVSNHTPICTCLPFHSGDPYDEGCENEKYGEHRYLDNS